MVWLAIEQFKGVYWYYPNYSSVSVVVKASSVALLYLIFPGLCSETFAMFSCRDVCGLTLLRVDLDEPCWEGRHGSFAWFLGVPMLICYVIGLPTFALVQTLRVHRRATNRGSRVEESKGHLTFGLLYSACKCVSGFLECCFFFYRIVFFISNTFCCPLADHSKIWWWEITVTVRKVFIALMGIFGGSMGEMQVHLTINVLFIFVLMTAVVRPFGNQKVLQFLELGTLAATWLTLWAGSVFNLHPKCENGRGGTVGWCTLLSIVIGIIDVVFVLLVVVAMVYYKQEKTCNACCLKTYDRTLGERKRRRLVRKESLRRARMNKQRNIVENPVENEKEIEMSDINDNSTDVVEKQDDGQDDMRNQKNVVAEDEVSDAGGWEKIKDETSGAFYLYHSVSKESKWVVENEQPVDNGHQNPMVLSNSL